VRGITSCWSSVNCLGSIRFSEKIAVVRVDGDNTYSTVPAVSGGRTRLVVKVLKLNGFDL